MGKREPLATQKPSLIAASSQLALFSWGVQQQVSSGILFSPKDAILVLVISYLYCDYWLWMLHCFLDRKENLVSKFNLIKHLAIAFQYHHDYPGNVLKENHLAETDLLVTLTTLTGVAMGTWTSANMKFIVLGVSLWGQLGALNHFYGHAITHRREVPSFYTIAQKFGLLPTAKHHKQHHSAPFEENWNFLNGLHWCIYEPIYFAGGSSYLPLFAMFYTMNPCSIQLLITSFQNLV